MGPWCLKLMDGGGMPTLDCRSLDQTQHSHNVTRLNHWLLRPLDRQGQSSFTRHHRWTMSMASFCAPVSHEACFVTRCHLCRATSFGGATRLLPRSRKGLGLD
jgi:hypothetical protein